MENIPNNLRFETFFSFDDIDSETLRKLINLYILGFQRAGWREQNNYNSSLNKFSEQFLGNHKEFVLTIIPSNEGEILNGFQSSQIFDNLNDAIERVLNSIFNYQVTPQQIPDDSRLLVNSQIQKLNLFNSDKPTIILEDIVLDSELQGINQSVFNDLVRNHIEEIFRKTNNNVNNYALSWSNSLNPICRIFTLLEYPIILRHKKNIGEYEIELVLFAVNLRDLYNATSNMRSLMRRLVLNKHKIDNK